MRAFDDKEMEGILRPIIASSDGVDSWIRTTAAHPRCSTIAYTTPYRRSLDENTHS